MDYYQQFHAYMQPLVEQLAKEKAIAVENLTREQLMEAIRQAVISGDFCRYVCFDTNSQAVLYTPYREVEQLKAEIAELKEQIQNLNNPNKP